MPVKLYLGHDQQGRPHAYTFTHEENGARRICQYMYDRLEGQKEHYTLIANPCYTGSFLELNPDMVIISELGLGIIELKHHFGEIDCGDPAGPWRAGSVVIEAGRGFANPHRQVQSYAEQIRNELIAQNKRWLPGTPAQLAQIKVHTSVCFTNPLSRLDKCREAAQIQYAPGRALRAWERFSVTHAAEIPNLAIDMRFEVQSEADWFSSYRLLPGEIDRLAAEFFHARPWQEMESFVRETHEPLAYLTVIDENRPEMPPFRIEREETLIGRNAGACNVVIPQNFSQVSNQHLRLIIANRRFYIEDLSSTNGSFFPDNPQRLSGIVEIKPSQRFSLGDFKPSSKVCTLELRVEHQLPPIITELIR
jgi:hypothetical protein